MGQVAEACRSAIPSYILFHRFASVSIKKALLHSFVEKYFVLCSQLVTTAIVSRLISPEEFGVFALAVSVTMLVQVFRDLGVGQYLVQEKELTEERMRAALTILSVSSILLFSIIILARHAVADFYSNKDIADLLLIISFSLLTMPFGALTLATLRRDMKFKRVASIGMVSALITSIVTIGLAYKGLSSFSLAWGMLANAICTVVCCVFMRPEGLPFLPGLRQLRHVMRYSMFATFNGLLEALEDRLSSLLLGRFSDFQNIGLYERGTTLAQIFQRVVMQGVWSVALPAFAQLSRSGGALAEPYARAVGMVCSVGVVFFLWLVVYADLAVSILLGANWVEVTPIVRLVALASIFGLPNALSGSMLIAIGEIKLQTLISVVLRGASLVAIAVGASSGAKGIATCLIVSSALSNMWLIWRLREYCAIRMVVRQMFLAVMLALPAVVVAYGVRLYSDHQLVWDITGWTLGACVWVALLVKSKHPLWVALQLRRT